MKSKQRFASLAACLATLLLASSVPAQDIQRGGVPVLSLDELFLRYYAVQHVSAGELLAAAQNTVGRRFFVTERGGVQGDAVYNLQLLGGSIVIYDREEAVMSILAACKALDQPRASAAPEAALEVMEYSPRYVSLRSIVDAVKPFVRSLDPDGNSNTRARNISEVEDQNVLLVHETPKRMAMIRAIIEQLDRPEIQVLLTCRLLRAVPGGKEEGLPEALVQNLRRLVPQYRFKAAGFAMLQSGVSPRQEIKLQMGQGFQLEFRPIAFDPKLDALTVERCRFTRPHRAGEEAGRREIFSTRVIFRAGEFTVLGASGGEEPIFVVVELAQLASPG